VDSKHLSKTPLLDFDHPRVRQIVAERGWRQLSEAERIGAVYDYVRERVPFGYNAADDVPASAVLADGFGQCNTKTTLLMALLRAAGIPCRFHGATIDKRLQKGLVPTLLYPIAPASIVHSWAEVRFEDRWIGLEGVILDAPYLDGLRATVGRRHGPFLGYGVGTEDLGDPPVTWRGADTSIQATGIDHDYGVFANPDEFYAQHGSNFSGARRLLFRYVVRTAMNRKVDALRARGPCGPAPLGELDLSVRQRE
jgi:transglutaminase-like putative cysteine protease